MKIIGIGIDIAEVPRIEAMIARHGERFLQRVFTEEERAYCSAMRVPAPCFAARFAAKEAVSKAFGTGIGGRVSWLDLTVRRDPAGKPSIALQGAAAEFARELGIAYILISLSHSEHYAVAQAIAVGL